jgi:hypothetical protein
MDGARDGESVFRESNSVRVTAQWSVNEPVIYVDHPAGSECVDLAISGPADNEVVTHVQLTNPLDVLTVGHNLVSAGVRLAETLGMDIEQLKAATPPAWWAHGDIQTDVQTDMDVTGEESPDS